MRTWKREGYTVVEKKFDYDLHIFDVVADSGEVIATIRPDTIEDMQNIIAALDAGEEVDGWEDGSGNTIRVDRELGN